MGFEQIEDVHAGSFVVQHSIAGIGNTDISAPVNRLEHIVQYLSIDQRDDQSLRVSVIGGWRRLHDGKHLLG